MLTVVFHAERGHDLNFGTRLIHWWAWAHLCEAFSVDRLIAVDLSEDGVPVDPAFTDYLARKRIELHCLPTLQEVYRRFRGLSSGQGWVLFEEPDPRRFKDRGVEPWPMEQGATTRFESSFLVFGPDQSGGLWEAPDSDPWVWAFIAAKRPLYALSAAAIALHDRVAELA